MLIIVINTQRVGSQVHISAYVLVSFCTVQDSLLSAMKEGDTENGRVLAITMWYDAEKCNCHTDECSLMCVCGIFRLQQVV